MATAVTTATLAPSSGLARRIVELIPGLLLLAAVGYAGKFIEQSIAAYTKSHHITFPNIEYVLWAIVIGLIIANTIGIPRIFQAGVATYEFWLKAGIVLLGSRFLLGDVLHLGGISLLLVAVALTLSLTFMHLLGRTFKLRPKLTSLLAIGSAICGVSAIIAAKPSIDADDEDASYAIAAILALGAISLFTFPLIGHSLHLSDSLRSVGRPGRGQHRGSHCRRRALFRRCRQGSSSCQDNPQRPHRVCGAGLCNLLGVPRRGTGNW